MSLSLTSKVFCAPLSVASCVGVSDAASNATALGFGKPFDVEQFAAASGASKTEVMHRTRGASDLSFKSRLCLSSHRDREWKLKLVTSAWMGVAGLSVASLVLAVHFFAYLAADAREWRQKHAAFEESDYWGI